MTSSSLDGDATVSQEGTGTACRGTAKAGGPASTNEIVLTLRDKTGTCDWAERDEVVLRR